MKRIIMIASLIGVLTLLAGCQKEFGHGGEVRFVASSNAGPATRAEYSGEGNTNSAGLLTWERIDWQEGDVIRVWSDQAATPSGVNYSDYKVSSFNVKSGDNTRSQASVVNASANGLNWDGVTGESEFWALYPSSLAGSATEKSLSLSISKSQTPDDGLKNAPMVAAVTGISPKSEVPLEFYPAFTAFEITLGSEDKEITLNSFKLTSSSKALSGNYTANVVANGGTTYAYGTPSSADKEVSYTFDPGTVITNSTDGEVTFTILALPQTYDDLVLEFSVTIDGQDQTRKLALKKSDGTAYSFAACSKHRIYGLAMPGNLWKFTIGLEFEVVEWIDGGTSNIDYTTGSAQASYFQFNQGEYEYADNLADVDRNTWTITFGSSKTLSTGVVYVQYSITTPLGTEWSVVPVDPLGYFNVVSVIDGEESPNLNGTVQTSGTNVKPIVLKITPNMSNIPSSRPEDYTMIIHTYAMAAGKMVNIDSETQTSDGRYDYTKFVIANNE